MSAFFGLVSLDGSPIDTSLIEESKSYLAPIGPDAQQSWHHENAGMVHALLKTSSANVSNDQPLKIGKFAVVGDARLDQRAHLLRMLEAKRKAEPADVSDVELILRAWQIWGPDSLKLIRGDFSVAIWDTEKRRLHCLRDQIGVKTLFYSRKGNVLYFSNVLGCILEFCKTSGDFQESFLVDFLAFGYSSVSSDTVYKDIKRLAPGHRLLADDKRFTIERYWSIPHEEKVDLPNLFDYPERFIELLTESVQDRLPDSNVSILMSGGLDSTSLASIAHHSPQREWRLALHTVDSSRVWPEDREVLYSTMVADFLGISHGIHEISDQDMFRGMINAQWKLPEPVRYSYWTGFLRVFDQMAKTGPVALTGQGGDGLLASSPMYFNALVRSRRWTRLASDTWKHWRVHRERPPLGLRPTLKEKFQRLPQAARRLPPWLRPDVVDRTGIADRLDIALSASESKGETLRPEAVKDLASPLWPSLVGRFDPQMTGIPLEFRHPYLDLRLIEFVLGTPAVPWFFHKALLRYAMKDRLPEQVRLRRKVMPAVPPVYTAMRRMALDIDRYIPKLQELDHIIDIDVLENVLRNRDKLTSNEADMVLLPISLSEWLNGAHVN